MISDEAVEAAVKAWKETPLGGDALMNALEAAAPHMQAEAWEEGWEAGSSDETDSYWGPCAVTTPNPYRSKP